MSAMSCQRQGAVHEGSLISCKRLRVCTVVVCVSVALPFLQGPRWSMHCVVVVQQAYFASLWLLSVSRQSWKKCGSKFEWKKSQKHGKKGWTIWLNIITSVPRSIVDFYPTLLFRLCSTLILYAAWRWHVTILFVVMPVHVCSVCLCLQEDQQIFNSV